MCAAGGRPAPGGRRPLWLACAVRAGDPRTRTGPPCREHEARRRAERGRKGEVAGARAFPPNTYRYGWSSRRGSTRCHKPRHKGDAHACTMRACAQCGAPLARARRYPRTQCSLRCHIRCSCPPLLLRRAPLQRCLRTHTVGRGVPPLVRCLRDRGERRVLVRNPAVAKCRVGRVGACSERRWRRPTWA